MLKTQIENYNKRNEDKLEKNEYKLKQKKN